MKTIEKSKNIRRRYILRLRLAYGKLIAPKSALTPTSGLTYTQEDTGYAYPLLLYPSRNRHLSNWTIINLLMDVLQQPLNGKWIGADVCVCFCWDGGYLSTLARTSAETRSRKALTCTFFVAHWLPVAGEYGLATRIWLPHLQTVWLEPSLQAEKQA